MSRDAAPRALLVVVVIAALVTISAVATPLASARPAHEIPVASVSDDLGETSADGWDNVPAATVSLASAPSSVPNADQTSIERVHVQAARSDERLYLRLQWSDATRDTAANETRTFADAVAVQFPADGTARPPIAMGGPDNRVNVWYWSPTIGTQELLAGGAGSTTPMAQPSIESDAAYRDGEDGAQWTVVYSRDIEAAGENRTTITDDGDLDVAFAVWNGSNGERAGRKSVSEWHYFPFGGGPSGPPFQALLWSIAGIAIVAVVAVTAFGVYRTGGEGR